MDSNQEVVDEELSLSAMADIVEALIEDRARPDVLPDRVFLGQTYMSIVKLVPKSSHAHGRN